MNREQSRIDKFNYVEGVTNPYPEKFTVSHTLAEASVLEDGVENVSVAGRITFMRKMGKLSFIMIQDIQGKVQAALKADTLSEEDHLLFQKGVDIGDFIGITGEMFTTKKGEKTVRAHRLFFLGKAFHSLPEKFHGLTNVDTLFRKRYLDLIMHQESRERFLTKTNFIRLVRRYLEDHQYLEIETPVIIDKPSGASARPFLSHHNALDLDVYLRIAPETYLKRAIVGGFTHVFEFARCFRNEGMDQTHLQDFTMLEGYAAYFNYKDNMDFLQGMLTHVITELFGQPSITVDGQTIDFAGEWPIVSFRALLIKDCGIDIDEFQTAEALLAEIKRLKITIDSQTPLEQLGRGNLIDQLYKKVSRPKIISPTYLTEHPVSLSPLARSNDDNTLISDRFQLIINGAEVINGYSELVDPVEQRKRLHEQAKLKAGGDDEAMVMDEDYLEAMEHGMPPISGWGMGIDRILQIITGEENIRNMVLFPLMRPHND